MTCAYQRFAFDNLPPERQREILEKQRKQEIQRNLLKEQLEERQRTKEGPPQPRRYSQADQPTALPPDMQPQYQQNIRPSATVPNPGNFNFQTSAFKSGPIFVAPQRPLLSDRQRAAPRDRQMLSMTLTPNKIHDTFSTLRTQIMNTAASTVISQSPTPNTTRTKRNPTFPED